MRAHLDATIEVESVRRIYQEYWAEADRAAMDTIARATMAEERGRNDCVYFDWHLDQLPTNTAP